MTLHGNWAHTYERHHKDVPVLSVILRERSASPRMGGSTCGRTSNMSLGQARVLIRSMHTPETGIQLL